MSKRSPNPFKTAPSDVLKDLKTLADDADLKTAEANVARATYNLNVAKVMKSLGENIATMSICLICGAVHLSTQRCPRCSQAAQ